MSKKFVVALHGAPQNRDPITTFFLGLGWHVWHWYADLWLLDGVPDDLTPGALYQQVKRSIPAVTFTSLIVLEMGPELRYYGTAPKSEAWPWMREHWGTPDFPETTGPLMQLAPESEGSRAAG